MKSRVQSPTAVIFSLFFPFFLFLSLLTAYGMWPVRRVDGLRSLDTAQAATTCLSTSRQVDSALISPNSCRRRLSLLCQPISPRVSSSEQKRPFTRPLFLRAHPVSERSRHCLILPVVKDKTCNDSASHFPDTSQRPSAARCLGKPAALPYISIAPKVVATQLGLSHSSHSSHMAVYPPSASS
jgi:hypothetical protein